jgi:hypothetical protein
VMLIDTAVAIYRNVVHGEPIPAWTYP